jgi:hypothetical protein
MASRDLEIFKLTAVINCAVYDSVEHMPSFEKSYQDTDKKKFHKRKGRGR